MGLAEGRVLRGRQETRPIRAEGANGDRAATDDRQRKRVLAFVGVQTGFMRPGASGRYDYAKRRAALRSTWFPGSAAGMAAVDAGGLALRFVVGHSADAAQEAALAAEEKEHGDFFRLDLQEAYLDLAHKTLAFLRAVTAAFDADFIVKVDDDVYLRIDLIPLAARQWAARQADYIGCMKNGPVFTDRRQRWFEPAHALLGAEYFTHAWGSMYVLSGRAAAAAATLPSGMLRFFNNEDVTVGSWMLAFNVTHFDDRRLCEPACSATSIAVYDYPACAGLCEPLEALPKLHTRDPMETAAPAEMMDCASDDLKSKRPRRLSDIRAFSVNTSFTDRASSASSEEAPVCWICLDTARPGQPLQRPCACPRYVHMACISRWCLQSAGSRKETHCEFCDSALPDWKQTLTPTCGASAPAVMNVNFDGRTYSFEVKPGPDGYRQFTEAIRRAFNLPEDSELNITFTCDEPSTTWEPEPQPTYVVDPQRASGDSPTFASGGLRGGAGGFDVLSPATPRDPRLGGGSGGIGTGGSGGVGAGSSSSGGAMVVPGAAPSAESSPGAASSTSETGPGKRRLAGFGRKIRSALCDLLTIKQ
ncbi:hypothetical protein WJX81_006529 [Elliptochloris bilobata]|uniref:RING-CH-type domain-containing protein n=1 Tax=Elliptochloris bilobata TaxID=381761 RepID=A0AAW1RCH3_9CHLO